MLVLALAWFLFIRPKNGQAETATVERGDVIEELVLSGEVQAREHASLAFVGSGELSQITVKEGDSVQKGQLLASLDGVSLWAAVQQADAALRDAQATLNRVYDQLKGRDKDESYAQIETRTAAETAKDSAYFALVAARNNYANSTLRAPFSGTITFVANNTPGVNVVAAQPQIEILNPNTIYFTVFADQVEIPLLKEGQSVQINLDPFPEDEVVGTITRVAVSPASQEVGVIYPIEVSIPVTSIGDNMLRIGMTGDATFELRSAKGVLYVPPQYVKRDSEGTYLLLENGRKEYIEIGVEGDERVEVKGNISEGTIVYD